MIDYLDDAAVMKEAARRAGYAIESVEPVTHEDGSHAFTRIVVDTDTNEGAIALLSQLAKLYAHRPEVLRLAAYLADYAVRTRPPGYSRDEAIASAIHAYVQRNVRFTMEDNETFRSPVMTINCAEGDCDDHALAVASLALAAGLKARLLPMGAGGEITHVVAQVLHEGKWHYLETTLAARYGEHPLEAARRLQVTHRSDIQ